jgi:anti-anti-sigma factor
VPEPFRITIDSLADCELVSVDGELDGGTAGELAALLDVLVAGGQPVVVDLTTLTFIDSGGLHALMKPRPNARLSVVCPPGNVSRVMSVVQLEHVLPVYELLDEALAALR